MTAPDLRPLIERAAEVSDLRLRRTQLRAGPGLLVLGAVFVAAAVATRSPGPLVFTELLGGLGVISVVGVYVRRRRPVAVLAGATGPDGPATQVRAPRGRFALGIWALGVVGSCPFGLGVAAMIVGEPVLGVVLMLIGTPFLLTVVMSLSGRYVAGSVTLDPERVRYRALGLESTVRWADLAVVEWSEPDRQVILRVRADATVTHRYRTWPMRGQKAEGPASALIDVGDWGLLATDLARLLVLCAADPALRATLGTPPALLRARSLVGHPVTQPRDRWLTGTGLPADHPAAPAPEPRQESWTPVDLPLWNEPAAVAGPRLLSGYYRARFFFTVGAASAGAGLAGVFTLVPQPLAGVSWLAMSAAGLCVTVAALRTFRPPVPAPAAGAAALGSDGVVLARSPLPRRLRLAAISALVVWAAATALAFGELSDAGRGLVWAVAVPLAATPVLLARRTTAGTITLTASEITYRSGVRRWAVPWSAVQSAQLAWDDVVYLRLHPDAAPEDADGAGLGLRDGSGGRLLDARGMAVSGAALAKAIDYWAPRGGPGGETRDVAAVAMRLGLRDFVGN